MCVCAHQWVYVGCTAGNVHLYVCTYPAPYMSVGHYTAVLYFNIRCFLVSVKNGES